MFSEILLISLQRRRGSLAAAARMKACDERFFPASARRRPEPRLFTINSTDETQKLCDQSKG